MNFFSEISYIFNYLYLDKFFANTPINLGIATTNLDLDLNLDVGEYLERLVELENLDLFSTMFI